MINKKGQVTIFIILGIIVVIFALGISYLNSESFRERIQSTVFKSVAVPEQAQGVVNFVTGCVEDLGKEGIKLMMMQGGYVVVPETISNNPRTYLPFTDNIKIPYWLYGEDVTSNIPNLEDMESELKNYIQTNFNEMCSLDSYRERGYEVDDQNFEVNVRIRGGKVDVDLISELKIRIKEDEFDLSKYVFVSITSKLGEFYEMANEIIDRELRNAPIEFNTMNLIALWSKEEDSGIPPVAGFDFSCTPKMYNFIDIGNELMRRISIMTPYLQVEGTNTQDFGDRFYDSMVIEDTFSKTHYYVDAQFSFFEGWPFVFDILPRNGLLLKSNVLKIPVPLAPDICFNSYDFRYNLLYPVVVSLEADSEVFKFPIELYINNNYGRRNAFGETSTRVRAPSLFCEDNQRISEEVQIIAYDYVTGSRLEDVDVTYICGIYDCYMGETKEDIEGNIEFKSKFPICFGGEVQLNKEGYGTYRARLDTVDEIARGISANMEPYRELNLGLEIINIDRDGFVLGARALGENENVVIQLNRINEEFGGIDESIVVSYDGSEEVKLNLVPGKYNAIVDLILNEEIELLGENVQGLYVEGQTTETIILGHIELDDLHITGGDLDNMEIIFKVFAIQPRTVGDLLRGYEMSDIVGRNRGMLDPDLR